MSFRLSVVRLSFSRGLLRLVARQTDYARVPRRRAAGKSSRSGSPPVRTTVCLVRLTRKVQPPGSARPVRSTRFTWKYPGWSGTGLAATGRKRVSGGAVSNQRYRLGGVGAGIDGFDAHGVGHLLRMTVIAEVEFGRDAGGFEVSVSSHRVLIPAFWTPAGTIPGFSRPPILTHQGLCR